LQTKHKRKLKTPNTSSYRHRQQRLKEKQKLSDHHSFDLHVISLLPEFQQPSLDDSDLAIHVFGIFHLQQHTPLLQQREDFEESLIK